MNTEETECRAEEVATNVIHHIDTMYPNMWEGVPKTARVSIRNTIIREVKQTVNEKCGSLDLECLGRLILSLERSLSDDGGIIQPLAKGCQVMNGTTAPLVALIKARENVGKIKILLKC